MRVNYSHLLAARAISVTVALVSLEGAKGRGSARSIPGFHLFEGLQRCREALLKFSGHAAAAGFAMQAGALAALQEKLEEAFIEQVGQEAPRPVLRVDAQVDLTDLDLNFFEHLDRLRPFGPGNPEPVFVCPGSQMRQFERREAPEAGVSALGHWPVKLRLVAPKAPFLKGAELLVAADCAPFAAGDLHARYLHGRAVLCGCPKFEDLEESAAKLADILKEYDIQGITIVNMEVPCCHGLGQRR